MSKLITFIVNVLKPSDDLLLSSLHTEVSFYKEFTNDLKRCKKTLIIESPYLTPKRTVNLLPLISRLVKCGVEVAVTTRHPCEYEGVQRDQAYDCMAMLHSAGIDLRLVTGHFHRKLAIIDDSVLWEGSLNILSQNRSMEMMRRIHSPSLARQMRRFIGY